ncbi:MAG: cysteine desulfurase family protein [Longimicrobiales bacterium]|nr:cysteine desulfurase family protein [Longimicrobiales bacterium]
MEPVYLDHAATTPLREEVLEAMRPCLEGRFGNPSSLHRWGRQAQAALEDARARIAHALGARPPEIRFVRGGTESDNLAILGSCRARHRDRGVATPLAMTSIEHSAVLEAARHAHTSGAARPRTVDVGPDGSIDVDSLLGILADGGGVVSLMWVNNETGLILPVDAVAESAKGHGALVHTDASQAVGKVPVDVSRVPVDLLTATGHKINGPKGAGILFVREGTPLEPILFGGGQERSLRPGTEDVAGAVGLAMAVELAVKEQRRDAERLRALRDRLESALVSSIPSLRINSGEGPRAAHVASVGIPDVDDGQRLLMALDLEGVAVSGGSACHSGAGKGSHVIAALYGEDDAMATVRYSLGRDTRAADVDRAVTATVAVIERLRASQEEVA